MAIDDDTSYELTGYQVKDLAQKIRAKADSNSLASVATSGLYSDIIGTPTIPTVYNGTLTIQQDGNTLGTFSANQSSNETINITGGGGAKIVEYVITDDLQHYSWGAGWIQQNPNLTGLNFNGSGNCVLVDYEKETLVDPGVIYDHYLNGDIIRIIQDFRSANFNKSPGGDMLSFFFNPYGSETTAVRGVFTLMYVDGGGTSVNFPYRLYSLRSHWPVSYGGDSSYIYDIGAN